MFPHIQHLIYHSGYEEPRFQLNIIKRIERNNIFGCFFWFSRFYGRRGLFRCICIFGRGGFFWYNLRSCQEIGREKCKVRRWCSQGSKPIISSNPQMLHRSKISDRPMCVGESIRPLLQCNVQRRPRCQDPTTPSLKAVL